MLHSKQNQTCIERNRIAKTSRAIEANDNRESSASGTPIQVGGDIILPPAMRTPDQQKDPELFMQPNPSVNKTSITFSHFIHPECAAFINIVNSEGNSVRVINISNTQTIYTLDVSKLPKGLYTIVVVNTMGENAYAKLIVATR